jgi:TPR repeat protein
MKRVLMAVCCLMAGNVFAARDCLREDAPSAREFIKNIYIAANNGDVDAQRLFGKCLINGYCVEQNPEEAAYYFKPVHR